MKTVQVVCDRHLQYRIRLRVPDGWNGDTVDEIRQRGWALEQWLYERVDEIDDCFGHGREHAVHDWEIVSDRWHSWAVDGDEGVVPPPEVLEAESVLADYVEGVL